MLLCKKRLQSHYTIRTLTEKKNILKPRLTFNANSKKICIDDIFECYAAVKNTLTKCIFLVLKKCHSYSLNFGLLLLICVLITIIKYYLPLYQNQCYV